MSEFAHSGPDGNDSSTEAVRLLAELVTSSQDVFVLTDTDGGVIHANHTDPDPRTFVEIVRQQMPRSAMSTVPSQWRGEVTVLGGDSNRTFDVQVIRGEANFAIHARDITSQVRLQQQLSHLATHDALTDLPNRTLLLRRLADSVDRSRMRHTSLAVLYVDIDDLKKVNDSVGHERGDDLIGAIGRRLVEATRPGDFVARIGGDEFVVLCENVDDERSAAHLADRVRLAATGPVESGDVDASVSVGVVLYTGFGGERTAAELARTLLDEADKAMYHAKLRGKSRCHVYTESMRAADRERSRLARDLEDAVQRDELFVEYQAIASPHTGRVVAAEALVRWQHPELGLLHPASFIDLADSDAAGRASSHDTGAAIDTWVLRQATVDLRRWIDEGRVDGRFAVHVNVSAAQVSRPEFADTVTEALAARGLHPFNLVLEFNEDLVLDHGTGIARTLQSLRRRGVRLSLDDFGAGTSSLTTLRTCPVDFVKMDGTLVRSIGDIEEDEHLVRSVVLLAHGVEASVIAESVTNAVQIDRLKVLGCDLMQGFHIAEPLPAANFVAGTATVFRA